MQKLKSLSVRSADSVADISIINEYSVKELTPDEVFCFSVVLCDNDVDRDNERFTDATLDQLAGYFLPRASAFNENKQNRFTSTIMVISQGNIVISAIFDYIKGLNTPILV